MKVLCAGGGSGGHVTPVVVVINEIVKQVPDAEVMFVCDKAFEHQAVGLMENNAVVPVRTKVIAAGKLRRYKHLTFWQHFTVSGLILKNAIDLVKVGLGTLQSVAIFATYKPDVVFAKGGYVCLPVGIAARLFRVPLVIHDSDARPGMTNSILSRWATKIGTGAPLENYNYPASRSEYVGVPIGDAFRPFSSEEMIEAKRKIAVSPHAPLVVVTGGGLGAKTINDAVLRSAKELLEKDMTIYHVTGKKHYDDVVRNAPKDDRYKIVPFVFDGMANVLGAADVVVSRASATFIQELAGLAKPSILVPSRALGDQVRNAEAYQRAEAAVVLTDDDIAEGSRLVQAIERLLSDSSLRSAYATKLHEFARPDAAAAVARLVVAAAKRR